MIFRNKREQRIASWLLKLDQGLSEEEELELEALSQSDPELVKEIRSSMKPWNIMSEFAPDIDPALIEEAESEKSTIHLFDFGSLTFRTMLAVACCCLLILSGVFFFNIHHGLHNEESLFVVQPDEEPLTKRFKDGSVVRINQGTRITYRFTDNVRLIHVAKGEAFFEVAKNPDLPFVVYNKRVRVKALGTAFNVKITEFDVGVSVTEGSVEILANQDALVDHADIDEIAQGLYDSGETLDILTVGEKTVVRTDQDVVVVSEAVPLIADELQWRESLLTFNGSTLQELSVEFERKTGIKLAVNDPRLQNLQVVGSYFSTNDPFVILKLIERNYGIQWEQIDAQTIVVGEME